MPGATQDRPKSETSLSITRTFDAPPERVFDAWMQADLIARWIGPRNFVASAQTLEMEPRVGGKYRIQMNIPDGSTRTVGGVYREIVRPSRLVFTWIWDHESKARGTDQMPANEPWGHETLITLTFRPVGKGTELTLLHENFPNVERRDSHNKGWSASMDQLAKVLAQG